MTTRTGRASNNSLPSLPPSARTSRLHTAARNLIPWEARDAARNLLIAAQTWRRYRGLSESIRKVRPYTMCYEPTLVSLARQVHDILVEGIPGDFVECGVWRGGTSFLMADILQRAHARGRRVWMFDSFEGLPTPTAEDGTRAVAYQAKVDDPRYFDNCTAEMNDVRATAARLGLENRVVLVPGWFQDTVPRMREQIGPIALLRLDGDWYESIKTCLEGFYDQVSPGGWIVLDDYDYWDGAALAVHEFLGTRKLSHRIKSDGQVYFRKLN